jgi:hypothetical protein
VFAIEIVANVKKHQHSHVTSLSYRHHLWHARKRELPATSELQTQRRRQQESGLNLALLFKANFADMSTTTNC